MERDDVFISGTGVYIPPNAITTEELVNSYNQYVEKHNQKNASQIVFGEKEFLKKSSADFVIRASGIHNRYVIDKQGILNTDIMHPVLMPRASDDLSIQCEMALHASREALSNAEKTPQDVDAVIVACSNMQRPYPAVSIELQSALGCRGFAYDINAACSSASFGINMARSLVLSNLASCVLVVTPELYTAHVNFRDRRSHFIFGDACSATIIENKKTLMTDNAYRILSGKLESKYSNNIYNNFGFLNRSERTDLFSDDKLFMQNGKKVRDEVVPFAATHIKEHLLSLSIHKKNIKRLWLHQANLHMNKGIAKLVLDREAKKDELPLVLNEFGNTGASGVMLTFHKYNQDLCAGDIGVICSFGAGYTVGSLIIEKL